MKHKGSLFMLALFGVTFLGSSLADELTQVGAEELKKMIVGCTVHNMCKVTGELSKTYFDPSGKYTRDQQGVITEGSYYIEDDGTQCNVVKGKPLCGQILKVGDGTYYRMSNGKRVGIWVNILPGKDM